MSNAVVNPTANLPVELQGFMDEFNIGITGGIKSGGHPRIGIKGSKWRIEEDGDEQVHNLTTLDVMIVGTNKSVSKVFYAGKYNPQATEFKAPDCFSDNGIGPSTGATAPQCGACEVCPHNAWGSKINELGNKTKACADYKKIAVVLADDPERNVFELRIPGASLQEFSKIMSRCANNKIFIPHVVFQLSFDPNVDYAKIQFRPTGYADDFQKGVVNQWLSAPETKEAVNGNDTARPATAQLPQANPHPAHAHQPRPVQQVQQQPVVQQPDPMAALGMPQEAPKRGRGRPKVTEAAPATQTGQGKPAEAPTGQMTFDLPGVQAPAQATPIQPAKTSADLDALLAGVLN